MHQRRLQSQVLVMTGIGVTLCDPNLLGLGSVPESQYQVSRWLPSSLPSWNELKMPWHNKLQVQGADMHPLYWDGPEKGDRYLGQVHGLKRSAAGQPQSSASFCKVCKRYQPIRGMKRNNLWKWNSEFDIKLMLFQYTYPYTIHVCSYMRYMY